MRIELFSRNFNGILLYWAIEKINDNTAQIYHGQYEGTIINNYINHPNIDKEIQSRLSKKKKEGYKVISLEGNGLYLKEDLEKQVPMVKYDDNWNTKPMKCQPFREKKLQYPVYGQPKLNGLRCTLRWEKRIEGEGIFKQPSSRAVLRTKEGLEYFLPHITTPLKEEMFNYNGIELAFDGEIYCHGKRLNEIKASSPMYNSKNTLSKSSGNPLTMNFHIFDLSISNMLQSERINVLTYLNSFNLKFEGNSIFNGSIYHVESVLINSDYEAQIFRDNCIKVGYEGCVLRTLDVEYAFGFRPQFIMKFKDHMDSEFLIIDVIPKPSDSTLPIFICRNDDNDQTFECIPIGSFDIQREYLINKEYYIGKYATVRYHERSGVKGVPFHANVIDIRETNKS